MSNYVKNPKAVCSRCEYERCHWEGVVTYPSSCDATRVTDTVTGRGCNKMLCKDKNKDGNCPDYKESAPTGCGVVMIVIAFILTFMIVALIVGANA